MLILPMMPDTERDACRVAYQVDRALVHHRELLHKALPDPADTTLFNRLMDEAKVMGMSWMDGLKYVIDKRRAMLN